MSLGKLIKRGIGCGILTVIAIPIIIWMVATGGGKLAIIIFGFLAVLAFMRFIAWLFS